MAASIKDRVATLLGLLMSEHPCSDQIGTYFKQHALCKHF